MHHAMRRNALGAALAVGLLSMPARGAEAGQVAAGSASERGMASAMGPETWARCAEHLSQPGARSYEISHPRSSTMPLSPFGGPYAPKYLETAGLPGTKQAFNMDVMNEGANPAQQGTQIDALGHFGYLDQAWDGTSPYPSDRVRYFGGHTQQEVKPAPDAPLQKLGVEKIPPIVTTAVLLDARKHVGGGNSMQGGELVTAGHLQAMLEAQGLAERGILPGDAVYVYTGWSERWKDPDTDKTYYTMAPGLSYDAAQWLGEKRIAVVGLDTPFVDAVAEGQLAGQAAPPPGTPEGMAFPIHNTLLAEKGIHLLENSKLDELARDQVFTSCTIILPLLEKGSSGSAVRPVAIGTPGR